MDSDFTPQRPSDEINKVLSQLDAARTDALQQTKDIQVILGSLLQHEAKRLETKRGKSNRRVQQVQLSLNNNLNIVRDLEGELEIARIKEPKVDPNSILIHGRIVDESYRGIAGVNVSLKNPSGTVISSVKTVETDSSGYYALEIDEESFNELENLAQEGLSITVSTRKGKQLYQQPQPLQLKKRDRTLVEVVLNRGDISPIGDIKRPT